MCLSYIVCPGNPISWCKCEAVINSMSSITVATEQAPPPPLMVMSLSLKITVNPKSGANEVGVAMGVANEVGVAMGGANKVGVAMGGAGRYDGMGNVCFWVTCESN